MAVGVLLPTREAVVFGDGDPAPLLDQAVAAEAAGFESVWVGDSLVARPRFEPLTLLAAVAARTSRVTIGTAVLLPALRHPVLLAHAAATLDRVAAGRLVLGVGAGAAVPGTETELAAVGVALDDRVGRLLRGMRLCRQLWSGAAPELPLAPLPHRPGGPPVWLGSEGPRMLVRAGREFDGWLPFSPTPEAWATGWAAVQAAAEAAGRDPGEITPAAYLTVTIDDDAGRALAEQQAYIEAYYDAPYDLMSAVQGCRAGTTDDVGEWLAAYVDAGARHLVLRLATRHDPAGQLAAAGALRSPGRW